MQNSFLKRKRGKNYFSELERKKCRACQPIDLKGQGHLQLKSTLHVYQSGEGRAKFHYVSAGRSELRP